MSLQNTATTDIAAYFLNNVPPTDSSTPRAANMSATNNTNVDTSKKAKWGSRSPLNTTDDSPHNSDGSHDSSNYSDSTQVFLDKLLALIRPIIAESVEATRISNELSLQKSLDDKLGPLLTRIDTLETENESLKSVVNTLQASVSDLNSKLDVQSSLTNEAMKWANSNEQYSRSRNVKIYGLTQIPDENPQDVARKLFASKLNVNLPESAINNAHRVNSNVTPKPLLVRFTSKADRRQVLIYRRKLKDSRIVIREDITSLTAKTLNRVRNNANVDSSWISNGKIYCDLKSGKKRVQVEPFDNMTLKLK